MLPSSYPEVALALLCLCNLMLEAVLYAGEPALEPGTTVTIRIGGVPEEDKRSLDGEYTISDRGSISLVHLDVPLKVSRLTPTQMARKIEQAYLLAKIYTRPTINVTYRHQDSLRSARPVSISGAVNAPSSVPFTPGLTLLDAISQARGFTKFANPRKIKLLRGKKTTIHDLSRVGINPEKNPNLKPGDLVIVPRSWR